MTATDPLAVASDFAVPGVPNHCAASTTGHINDTWFITTDTGAQYVLQAINARVFADPRGVANNTQRVITHATQRASRLVPAFVAARDGRAWVEEDGAIYRMLGYVAGSSVDDLRSVAQATAAGAAFGAFQRALADYDRAGHVVPIAHFHELDWQLDRFSNVLTQPTGARRTDAANEIDWVRRLRNEMAAAEAGPHGMIHGDGKVNNLIFDAADAVRAVIDLDTVMWGALSWDFGDLVRSAAALGPEDDEAITFSVDRFAALCRGYVRGTGDLMSEALRLALPGAAAYMTFMLALRFLIDHLDGDRYFRVSYPGHNLVRARSQLRLLEQLREAQARLEEIVKGA